jgi:glucosylceramidase
MCHFSIERDRNCLIPYLKAAQEIQPGLTLFASPWSPPSWMKRPKAYNYGRLAWDEKYLSAYSRYLLKFVRAYRDEGIEIEQIHVQNEPNSDQKFPSCVWTGEKMRDFIRDYLGPTFREASERCQIWAGTIEKNDYNHWANTILSDPGARQYVGGVGYQWAGKGVVQRTHESWPDVPIIQTENECGDGRNTWEYAHYVFDLMRHYIGNGVIAYTYWNMVLEPGGESTWGWKQNSMVTVDPDAKSVTYNPEYFVMKHFAHFVTPGSVRLGVEGRLSGNAVAFERPGGTIVCLAANPFDSERTASVAIGGSCFRCVLAPRSVNTFLFS